MTGRTGTIETPRYPKKYKNKQTCIWHIRIRPGYRVKLMIKAKFGIGLERNTTKCLRRDHLVISSRRQGFSEYRFEKRYFGIAGSGLLFGPCSLYFHSNLAFIAVEVKRTGLKEQHQISSKCGAERSRAVYWCPSNFGFFLQPLPKHLIF